MKTAVVGTTKPPRRSPLAQTFSQFEYMPEPYSLTEQARRAAPSEHPSYVHRSSRAKLSTERGGAVERQQRPNRSPPATQQWSSRLHPTPQASARAADALHEMEISSIARELEVRDQASGAVVTYSLAELRALRDSPFSSVSVTCNLCVSLCFCDLQLSVSVTGATRPSPRCRCRVRCPPACPASCRGRSHELAGEENTIEHNAYGPWGVHG